MHRPKWVRALHLFMTDTIVDDEYGYPMNGADDEILERIEAAVNGVLCAEYGHQIEQDQCGIPSHAYCVWCQRGIVDINHITHARHCSCLDDSAECCVESCPCPRVSHRRPATSENVDSPTPGGQGLTEINGVAWCISHDSWWPEGDASCHADRIEGVYGTGGCIETPLYRGQP